MVNTFWSLQDLYVNIYKRQKQLVEKVETLKKKVEK